MLYYKNYDKKFSFCEEVAEDEEKKQILLKYLPIICDGLVKIVVDNSENQIGIQSLETIANVLSLMDDKNLDELENKVGPLAIAMFLKFYM